MGATRVDSTSSRARHADSAGMPPQGYRGGVWDPETGLQTDSDMEQRIVRPGPGSKGKRTVANNSRSGFNLRGVIEVLSEHFLDPVAELSKSLMERKTVTDRDGVPLLDKNGQMVTEFILPLDVRTKTLAGLIEYVHPKLKSVEMNVKKAELSDEQVEQRLAALLLQAQLAAAKKD